MLDGEDSEVDKLISKGVLVESERQEMLKISDEFRESREELMNDGINLEVHGPELGAFYEHSMYSLAEYSTEDEIEIVASMKALAEFFDSKKSDEMSAYAVVLDILKHTSKEDGIPDGFLPIPADQIEGYLSVYPNTIMYFWKENSTSCESLSEEYSKLVRTNSIPHDIGLIAIHAPEYADIIKEKYGVGIAPTTVLCKGGTPELRFIGYKSSEEITDHVERAYRSI